MFTFKKATLQLLAAASIAIGVLTLSACGGGGGSLSGPAPVPQPPVNPIAQTLSLPLPQAGVANAALPGVSGFREAMSFPANNAPSGTMLSLTVSSQAPNNMPTLAPDMFVAQPFLYLTLSSNHTVTLNNYPSFTMTLPSGVKLNSLPVKIGYYDRASGWKHIRDLTLVGSTATFTPSGTTNITLNAGVKYYAITYTCGAPNIYIANALGTDFKITLYDENGNQLSTLGRFLNLYAPIAIAFDSYNQHFYVADEDSSAFIKVYDRNGNQLTTSGTFQNLRSPVNGMAFDSSNRHLYVVSYSAGPVITIYDENGNQIIPSGAFPNIDNPIAIAFDSSNNYLYVTDNNDFRHATIRVYDQNGNQISTSGTFPNLTPQLVDIAFDSSNNHLYVVHYQESRSGVNPDAPDSITEYDQDGNQVPTSGSFPNLNGPTGVAFDPTNNHLYVTNIFGAVKIIVYDENGNQITTSGTFQGLHAPAALTAVP